MLSFAIAVGLPGLRTAEVLLHVRIHKKSLQQSYNQGGALRVTRTLSCAFFAVYSRFFADFVHTLLCTGVSTRRGHLPWLFAYQDHVRL